MVKVESEFGGIPCPETVQRKRCKIRRCTRGLRASDRKKAKQDPTERRRAKEGRESVWTNEEMPGRIFNFCCWFRSVLVCFTIVFLQQTRKRLTSEM